MKVVIPVAGIGSRLRPHTHTQPKSLVPIAGKAILAHIIDDLIEGGMQDFIFVLGYLGDKVEDFIRRNYQDSIKATFVIQEPREGLAHAIWTARETFEKEEEILVVLGDTIARVALRTFIDSPVSTLGVKKVGEPSLFGIAEVDQAGKVIKLVEKPKIPKSNLALVGIYKIRNVTLLLSSIEQLMRENHKTRDEYQLTDALMRMVQAGEEMHTVLVDHWYDCGKKETLLEANAILLNHDKFKHDFPKEAYPSAIILPPVSIGKNCQIKDSIIGPNVAVGDHTIVQYSIVQNSIIGSFSELKNVVLKNSIVGNDSSIKGLSQSLNIGDNTEL
ncbi:MAG: sugar phosphate nucleotidyltransferase, partial [Bacteroidota bacterium]